MNTINTMTEAQTEYLWDLIEKTTDEALANEAREAISNRCMYSSSAASGLIDALKAAPVKPRATSEIAIEREKKIAAGTDPRLTW